MADIGRTILTLPIQPPALSAAGRPAELPVRPAAARGAAADDAVEPVAPGTLARKRSRTIRRTVTTVALAGVAAAASGARAEAVRCEATRDVWLSAANRKERDCNMGAAPTIKLKVWQESGLVDFDVAALKGKTVTAAAVYVKPAGGHKLGLNGGTDLKWLTVSTVGHDWVEGRSRDYSPDPAGSGATFNESSYKKADWGFEGARCWDVILGNGRTLRCDRPLEPVNGWLRAEIDPRMVQALLAGASHGLLLMDGATSVGVNCRIFARESGKGPYLVVTAGAADTTPPAAPTGVTVTPAPNWATPRYGAAWLSVRVPDEAFAYHVRVNGRAVERWQLPFAGKAGTIHKFPILDLPGGAALSVEIAAVDAAGNVSAFTQASGRAGPPLTVPDLPDSPFKPAGGAPKALGTARIWAFPEVTKVDPVTGKLLNEKTVGDPRGRNAVWDGATGTIRLAAARGEIVSFQLAVEGKVGGCTVAVSDLAGPGTVSRSGVRLWRNWYVGRDPEYALPLTGPFDCPSADNKVSGQTLQAVTVDYHIPTAAKPGDYAGTVTLTAGAATLELPLTVKVYDVVLPDTVQFNPELNCYGGPGTAGSAKFKDSFRLAHYHRCTINRVPYSQGGSVSDDWTPRIDDRGRVTDWSSFDRNLGGLLDGTWFADHPRPGVPVPTLYLPLFEGWPRNFRKHYQPGQGVPLDAKDANQKLRHDILARPIDEAMDQAFKDAWVACTRDFVAHARAKGWTRTIFECYLNNKPKYGYTLWTLDEPFEYLDWAALNFFARLFKEGVHDPAVYTRAWHERFDAQGLAGMNRERPTFLFRGDVSRPMWQGNVSDGLMNILYSGGVLTEVPRLLRFTKLRAPTILYAYGSCNPVGRSNWESAAWCLKTFTLNGDGVLPWQSLSGAGALTKPTPTALIVDTGHRHGHAVASFRVHALRRGAQDCELLRLLQHKMGWSREHLGVLVGQKVPLTSEFRQQFTDQAAAVTFGTLTGQGFCEMKEGVLQLLTR